MKKVVLPFLCGVLSVVLLSATVYSYEIRKSTAEAEQIEGLYVFVDSKPVSEYTYLGTVKGAGVGASFNPQYNTIRNAMLKKVRKEYSSADGVILHLNAGGKDSADAIKFK